MEKYIAASIIILYPFAMGLCIWLVTKAAFLIISLLKARMIFEIAAIVVYVCVLFLVLGTITWIFINWAIVISDYQYFDEIKSDFSNWLCHLADLVKS